LYDAFGHRIEKDVWATGGSTTVTHFAWDNSAPGGKGVGIGEIWADLKSDNTPQIYYVHGAGVDNLIARVDSAHVLSWYNTDRMGSVRNITDGSGNVLDTVTYDGWGNVLTESSAANGDRWKYTGRELDSETGLQYNRARYFDAKTGRWTSEDPLGFGGRDTNLYAYVHNRSTSKVDPRGLISEDKGIGVIVTGKDGQPIGTIIVDVVSGSIQAEFSNEQNGKMQPLQEIAELVGADHFNWFQIIVEDDNPPVGEKPPYVDPPSGAELAKNKKADDKPGFYNEKGSENSPSTVANHDLGDRFTYRDQPSEPKDGHITVRTWIIGVDAAGIPVYYGDGFEWREDFKDGKGTIGEPKGIGKPSDNERKLGDNFM
jgi:RHS repeat-associated protein